MQGLPIPAADDDLLDTTMSLVTRDVMDGRVLNFGRMLVDGTRDRSVPIGRQEDETIGSRRWLAGLQSVNTFNQPPSTLRHQQYFTVISSFNDHATALQSSVRESTFKVTRTTESCPACPQQNHGEWCGEGMNFSVETPITVPIVK